MKPLPDLTNTVALAAWGRRSMLMKARNEACELLRDIAVRANSQDINVAGEELDDAALAVDRLKQIAKLWNAA